VKLLLGRNDLKPSHNRPPPQTLRIFTLYLSVYTISRSLSFCAEVSAHAPGLRNVDLIIQFDPLFARNDQHRWMGSMVRAGCAKQAIMSLMLGPDV